ncbi:MAG: hypothetical protein LBB14_01510 [Puniceicoccales bacterium]|jgi:ADP-heptose:LPS heptosyltransferase/lauroyl/myristoyl acyltransferase|nr:hypothetical protein [Puniceicoccales bacterium]
MAYLALSLLGFLLARLPGWAVGTLSHAIGALFYALSPFRRRVMAANLRCAYPDLDARRRRSIARRSSARLIELGMFSLALPFLSKRRIRKNFSLKNDWKDFANRAGGRLLLIPHQTLSEALVLAPFLDRTVLEKEVAVLYRPFRNRSIDRLVFRGRSRFGIKPLSRRSELLGAGHLLGRGGCVALLFDQYAGLSGTQSLFFGRTAIGSGLAETFAKRSGAAVFVAHVERTGPWRGKIILEPLSADEPITFAADRWLEEKLRQGEDDWLWAHNRWKRPKERLLSLEWRKDRIPELCRLRAMEELPKKTKILVRMPNWLGDNVMAIPTLRSLRKGRPDAHITVLCPRPYSDWLAQLSFVDSVTSLPDKNIDYFRMGKKFPDLRPDIHILFTNSLRGDWEALQLQSPIRVGFRVGHNRWRPFLTHLLPVSGGPGRHRAAIWHNSLEQIGLPPTLSREPIRRAEVPGHSIAIFPGASNCQSAKCWPPERWRALVKMFLEEFPERTVYLLGSAGDRPLAKKVGGGLPEGRLRNFTGRTTILELLALLDGCALALAVDTGAMHLANCYGIPTVALFGPTDPSETGPFFDGPKAILRPGGGPGFPMEKLSVGEVFSGAAELLNLSPKC